VADATIPDAYYVLLKHFLGEPAGNLELENS